MFMEIIIVIVINNKCPQTLRIPNTKFEMERLLCILMHIKFMKIEVKIICNKFLGRIEVGSQCDNLV